MVVVTRGGHPCVKFLAAVASDRDRIGRMCQGRRRYCPGRKASSKTILLTVAGGSGGMKENGRGEGPPYLSDTWDRKVVVTGNCTVILGGVHESSGFSGGGGQRREGESYVVRTGDGVD